MILKFVSGILWEINLKGEVMSDKYQKYIEMAIDGINVNAPKIVENGDIYYRNRIVDFATSRYATDPDNFNEIFTWVKPDLIKDELRAQHHGKAIGQQAGWITSGQDKHYLLAMARVKREIRDAVKDMGISKEMESSVTMS